MTKQNNMPDDTYTFSVKKDDLKKLQKSCLHIMEYGVTQKDARLVDFMDAILKSLHALINKDGEK